MTTRSSTGMPGAAQAGADDRATLAAIALGRTHYENFPVLAPFLGGRRNELALVYAFCRTTDDLGDELPGDRLAALDRWESMVRRAVAGDPPAVAVPPSL